MHTLNIVRLAQSLLLTALLLIPVARVFAQEPDDEPSPSPAATPQQNPSASPQPTATPKPRVVRVQGNVELDDIVEVNIENLQKWAETNDPSKLVPYIDGRAIKG